MARIRVLIVDDHEVVRVGLRALFEMEPDLSVVGEAAGGDAAVREAETHRAHVVLMDIRMGLTDGIQACRMIKSGLPDVAVLMLTSYGTEEAVLASLMAGAAGFLLKNTGRDDLLRAVCTVAGGKSLLDPTVTKRITERLVELASKAEDERIAALSPREREVLPLVAQGLTNRQIAERLVIAEATARNHVSHILDRLGMSRRAEAAAFAAQMGLAG